MQFYKRQTQMLWFGFTVLQAEVPLLGHGSLQLGSAELPPSLKLRGESQRLCWVQGLVPVQLCELLLQKT